MRLELVAAFVGIRRHSGEPLFQLLQDLRKPRGAAREGNVPVVLFSEHPLDMLLPEPEAVTVSLTRFAHPSSPPLSRIPG